MNNEDRDCKLCKKQVDHYGRCRNSSCELELRPQLPDLTKAKKEELPSSMSSSSSEPR